MGYVINKC